MMKEYQRPVVELAEGLSAVMRNRKQQKIIRKSVSMADGRQIRGSICVRPVLLQMAYLQMVRDISGKTLADARRICQ